MREGNEKIRTMIEVFGKTGDNCLICHIPIKDIKEPVAHALVHRKNGEIK